MSTAQEIANQVMGALRARAHDGLYRDEIDDDDLAAHVERACAPTIAVMRQEVHALISAHNANLKPAPTYGELFAELRGAQ